jgi:hypothetical protein
MIIDAQHSSPPTLTSRTDDGHPDAGRKRPMNDTSPAVSEMIAVEYTEHDPD